MYEFIDSRIYGFMDIWIYNRFIDFTIYGFIACNIYICMLV